MKIVLLKIMVLFFALFYISSNSVLGQCLNASTTYKPKIFEAVTIKKTKEEIITRYNQFISYYCNHDFNNLYKMLSLDYLKSTRKISGEEFSEQEWINHQLEFYSDEKTRFISFVPKEIFEWKDTEGKIVNWEINGCLAEKVNGKKRKVQAGTNVSKQSDGIYFSAVIPMVVSLNGTNQKCY